MKLMVLVSLISISASASIVELAEKIDLNKKVLVQTDKAQRQAVFNIHQIDGKIKKINQNFSELNQKVFDFENRARATAQSIAELKDKIKSQRKQLGQRMSAIYKMNDLGVLRLLLADQGMVNFDKNLKFLKLVVQRDYDLIGQYRENLKNLEIKEKSLKKQLVKLTQSKKNLKHIEKKLESQQKNKVKLLTALRKKHKDKLKEIKQLRSSVKDYTLDEFTVELSELMQTSFYEYKGKMHPPVNGSVAIKYGLYTEPEYLFRLNHKGLFYSSNKDSYVRSVYPGTVEYVGEWQGTGGVVIINHGDNYYSLYAHLRNIQVQQGDRLNLQQEFAQVDADPVLDKSGIYFELRHFSEAIDPQPWFKKEQLANY